MNSYGSFKMMKHSKICPCFNIDCIDSLICQHLLKHCCGIGSNRMNSNLDSDLDSVEDLDVCGAI